MRLYRSIATAVLLAATLGPPIDAQTARDSVHYRSTKPPIDTLVLYAQTKSASARVKRQVKALKAWVDALYLSLQPVPIPVPPKPDTLPTPQPPAPGPTIVAELPRQLPAVTTPAPLRQVKVCATCSLQAAINAAQSGDELLLPVGSIYHENIDLPDKGAAQSWITIRTDTVAPAGRMTPTRSNALGLAKIRTRTNVAVFKTNMTAHHWRLTLLDIGGDSTANDVTGLIRVGDAAAPQISKTNEAHDFILDRLYVHGTPTQVIRRCIALNGWRAAVLDSWISDCHNNNQDSQAIAMWNGTGVYLIENNHLEAGHEIVMFGGGDPSTPNMVPADATVRRNHIYRPPQWRGVWQMKNLFETKNVIRLLVEGNVLENVWPDAQQGFAFLLKSTNQSATAPWSITADVTIRYNIINNAAHGFNIATNPASQTVARLNIHDNVFGPFSTTYETIDLMLQAGVNDVLFAHNRFASATNTAVTFGDAFPTNRITLHSNVFLEPGQYGVKGPGFASGTPTLNNWVVKGGGLWSHNVLVGLGAACSGYPASPATFCTLTAPPQMGYDNRPVGPDMALVNAATAGVVVAP